MRKKGEKLAFKDNLLTANQSHILSSSIFILSVILLCILIDLKLDILPIRVVSSAYKM